jgi:hypothetical protein
MQLIYGSDAGEQPPWVVERAEAGARLKGDADCARVQIRRQPGTAPVPENRLCVESNILQALDASGAWAPQRPVGPRMEMTLTRANGDIVRIVTGEAGEETIGALRIRTVATVMTTTDASGRPRQRLTERYAVTLTTATSGRFEVPDAAAPSGWKTAQAFELRSIVFP